VGWFIPIANLYIPYAVVQDIWCGSDRANRMVGLQQRPQSSLITAWWICFLLSNVSLTLPASRSQIATLATISALLSVAAAVLAARVIRRINDLQVSEPSASPAPAA
jgi:hypothetical protein